MAACLITWLSDIKSNITNKLLALKTLELVTCDFTLMGLNILLCWALLFFSKWRQCPVT